MNSEQLKKLFYSIKTDNVKLFSSFMLSETDFNICYGRFPILSLCYLYKSYNIIDNYEHYMLKINKYNIVQEYFEIYKKFKSVAKKSLRLYLNNEIVTPLEMLSIIDDRKMIAKDYKKYYKNDEICSKIQKIYFLTHNTEVVSTIIEFNAPAKKKTKKINLAYSIISIFLCIMIILSCINITIIKNKFGLGLDNYPLHISNEKEFITALSHGSNNYILDSDIELTQNIECKNFSGSIDGNEKIITISSNIKNPIIDNLIGKITNLTFHINFEQIKIQSNLSLISNTLSGTITNCNVVGSVVGEFSNTEDTSFSIYTNKNTGTIDNSFVNLSVSIKNIGENNAFFCSFAAENDGTISNCSVEKNSFSTDTVDIAGFSITNNGKINNCTNNADISQKSDKLWHPNTAGFSITNNGEINNVINNGIIISETTNENTDTTQGSDFYAYAAGIVISNNGKIDNATNNANIKVSSIKANSYASGIAIHNYLDIKNSSNTGEINSSSQTNNVFASGIICENSFTYNTYNNTNYFQNIANESSVEKCNNSGEIIAKITENCEDVYAYASGIVNYNFTKINESINSGNINCTTKSSKIYAGGIVSYSGYTSISSYISDIYIKNSTSNCNINAVSEKEEICIGGICGYNLYAPISDCGYIGNINCNSDLSKIGGIVGHGKNVKLTNSYTSTTIDVESSNSETIDVESSDSESVIYKGQFFGIYEYYYSIFFTVTDSKTIINENLNNNHFVSNDDMAGLYFKNSLTTERVEADDCNAQKFKNNDEMLNFIENNKDVGDEK